MAKCVLIGGGEVRKSRGYETGKIDEEIVRMTGKTKPNFLFVGLANSFADSYYDTMKDIYKGLGCECSYLKKKNIINNFDIVKNKINKADIIYVGGGDSIKLMDDLQQYGVDELFRNLRDDVVLVGMSAGAIMIAKQGYSDSLILRGVADDYSFVLGLDLIDISICPHYNKIDRKESIKKSLNNLDLKVFGLENGAALKIVNDKIEVITCLDDAKCYLCYWEDGKYIEEVDYGNDKMQ